MRNKGITTIVVLLVFINGYKKISAESMINKSWPENSTEKVNFILSNFENNKKYKVSEDIERFKKYFIGGIWGLPPTQALIIKSNGEYDIIDYNEKKTTSGGYWKIEGDFLLLKKSNNSKWIKNEILFYKAQCNNIKNNNKCEVRIRFSDTVLGMANSLLIIVKPGTP